MAIFFRLPDLSYSFQQRIAMQAAALLATKANPAPGFIAYDEIAIRYRHFALMVRTKSLSGNVCRGLGYQRQPVLSL
jgi:hypothetical protein